MNSNNDESLLDAYMKTVVVLDTKDHYLYLGKLAKLDLHFVCLQDADVHDLNISRTPKDLYLIDAKKYGINASRKEVLVIREQIMSISKLEDILEF
ncbi:MAG: hypothetical protein AABZ60_15760 [Planctomycetota bacterium]